MFFYALPEMPVFIHFRHPGGDSPLPQWPAHDEPSAHDAVAGRFDLSRLRLVPVLDSALLAFRRLAAPYAHTARTSRGI